MGKDASQGEALMAQAAKKAAGGGGFASMFGSSAATRAEEAAEMYIQASNAFRAEQRYKDSGDAAVRAAECALKANEPHDASNHFWTASKAYKRTHPELAVTALRRTIELLVKQGRFSQAADRQKDIAQIMQQDGSEPGQTFEAWQQAAEWYASDDKMVAATTCWREAADIAAANLGQYDQAIALYDKVIEESMQSSLAKYSVKDYFLKSGFCHLCKPDTVAARRAIEGFVARDKNFETTREYKFLTEMAEAKDEGDQEKFADAAREYDRLTKLDAWKTTVLLKIREGITEPSLT